MSYKDHLNKLNLNNEDRKEILHTFSDLRDSMSPRRETMKIILIYIFIGSLWILFSDRLLFDSVKDPLMYNKLQTYKGWIYVFLSGLVFYFLIANRMFLLKTATDRIYKGYEELDKSYEVLKIAQDELEDKYNQLEHYKKALDDSQLTYTLSIEGSNDGVWSWNIDSDEYYTSLLLKPEFGFSDEEVSSYNTMKKWRELVHPDDLKYGTKIMDTFVNEGNEIYENIFRVSTKSGEFRWILSRGKIFRDDSGKALRFAGSHTDLTNQFGLQESLRKEKELVDSIANDSPTLIIVCDKDGIITKFNQFAERILEYKGIDIVGTNIVDFLLPFGDKNKIDNIINDLLDGKNMSSMEITVRNREKKEITLLWNNSFLHDKENNIEGFVFIGVDITERKLMEEELEKLAYYDSLTKLPNREKFKHDFLESINSLQTESLLGVSYVDIDNFKLVNDTMGHDAGDDLLLFITDGIKNIIGDTANLYRFGGDEFVLLFDKNSSIENINQMMDIIIESIRKPWDYEDNEFVVSASAGLALYPEHGDNFETIMRNADTALAYAKESGKNKYLIYNNLMRLKTLEFMQLSNDLRNASLNDQFILVYQPQVDLKNNKVIGVEALIRWQHPLKGMISPVDFIPFAEETGQIELIDEWVIKSSREQLKIWENEGIINLKLAINISGKMISRNKWVDRIKTCYLDEKGGSSITFEITETAIINDIDGILETLKEIKELGVRIALDDFGTGYSSLTYLQKLPIDIIKLDREFIWSIGSENDKSPIIKTVIKLAHDLNIKVVAEGVETLEQLEFLKKANCDYAQGYYFSKPLDVVEITKLLKYNEL